jgi:hypothetical protein
MLCNFWNSQVALVKAGCMQIWYFDQRETLTDDIYKSFAIVQPQKDWGARFFFLFGLNKNCTRLNLDCLFSVRASRFYKWRWFILEQIKQRFSEPIGVHAHICALLFHLTIWYMLELLISDSLLYWSRFLYFSRMRSWGLWRNFYHVQLDLEKLNSSKMDWTAFTGNFPLNFKQHQVQFEACLHNKLLHQLKTAQKVCKMWAWCHELCLVQKFFERCRGFLRLANECLLLKIHNQSSLIVEYWLYLGIWKDFEVQLDLILIMSSLFSKLCKLKEFLVCFWSNWNDSMSLKVGLIQ